MTVTTMDKLKDFRIRIKIKDGKTTVTDKTVSMRRFNTSKYPTLSKLLWAFRTRIKNHLAKYKGTLYFIEVIYGRGKTTEGVEDIDNRAEYNNKPDFINALEIFASKDEVEDYVKGFAI